MNLTTKKYDFSNSGCLLVLRRCVVLLSLFFSATCLGQHLESPKWSSGIIEYKSKKILLLRNQEAAYAMDTSEATILLITGNGVPSKLVVDIPDRFFMTSAGFKYEEYLFAGSVIMCSYAISEGNKYGILSFTFNLRDTSGIPEAITLTVTDNLFSKNVVIEKFELLELTLSAPANLAQPAWTSDLVRYKTAKVRIKNEKKTITFNGYKDGLLDIKSDGGHPHSFSAKLSGYFDFTDVQIDMISFKAIHDAQVILYSGKTPNNRINIGLEYKNLFDVETILAGTKPSKIIVDVTTNSKPFKVLSTYEISNLKE